MAKKTDHTNREHALLSASGSNRWMNCTPSAVLEDKYIQATGDDGSSPYAKEGTLAHEFGDLNLRYLNGEITKKTLDKELKKLRKNEFYTDEMEEQVEKYTSYVWEQYLVALKTTPDAIFKVEERLDYSHIVPKGYGTGDANIIADSILDVSDLKYGKGLQVEAKENSQLMLYGSGALKEWEIFYDIKTVRLTIVQPRLNHVSTWEISAEELRTWGEKIVRPKAVKAYKGEGKQQAGDWCKFCKVKGMCATLAAKMVKLAKYDFQDPHLLKDDQILDIKKQIPMLVDWAKSVDDHILTTAKAGKDWPGYKLVEGRSSRKWQDEKAIQDILAKKGYKEEEYLKMSLEGIGAIEKLVGKSNFNTLLGKHVVKPTGAPTLTDIDDKRPAMGIEQAKEDFK